MCGGGFGAAAHSGGGSSSVEIVEFFSTPTFRSGVFAREHHHFNCISKADPRSHRQTTFRDSFWGVMRNNWIRPSHTWVCRLSYLNFIKYDMLNKYKTGPFQFEIKYIPSPISKYLLVQFTLRSLLRPPYHVQVWTSQASIISLLSDHFDRQMSRIVREKQMGMKLSRNLLCAIY